MRSAVSYVLIAIVCGVAGAVVTQSGNIYDKVAQHFSTEPQEPEGFWSTPAIENYGKIHYEADAAFKPVAGLSNKIVFQITRSDGAMAEPNLGLERVTRVVNLYIASGIPADQLKFVVSVTGDATTAMLDNAHFRQFYGTDNPNLKLIDELNKTGVKVSVCDQSVAFHQLEREWIDPMVTHTISSGTTVATLQNEGYAFLML